MFIIRSFDSPVSSPELGFRAGGRPGPERTPAGAGVSHPTAPTSRAGRPSQQTRPASDPTCRERGGVGEVRGGGRRGGATRVRGRSSGVGWEGGRRKGRFHAEDPSHAGDLSLRDPSHAESSSQAIRNERIERAPWPAGSARARPTGPTSPGSREPLAAFRHHAASPREQS